MLSKGYLLMRREGYFTIIPADERPDPALVPTVKARRPEGSRGSRIREGHLRSSQDRERGRHRG